MSRATKRDVKVYQSMIVNHVDECDKLRTCACPRSPQKGVWEYDIRFYWPSGKPFREQRLVPVTGITERQAHTWATQRKNALLATGEYAYTQQKEEREAQVVAPTLREFGPEYIKMCKADRQKPRTVQEKENILEYYLYPRFGDRRLNEFGDNEIDSIRAEFAGLNPKTLNNVFSVFNTLMAKAKRANKIKSVAVVAEHFDLPDIEDSPFDYYEPEVYELVVSAAQAYDRRAHLVCLLGGDAGLRRGEIVALEQADLDFRSGLINVRRSESKGFLALPKGGRPRKVDMTERLKKALLEYRHSQSPRVLWRDLTNPREKDYPAVTEVSIRNWMEEVQKRAAAVDARVLVTGNIHILRHTFCSRLAMLGVPALTIKQLAGHTSMRTTLRYMHLSPTARSGGIKALDAAIEQEQAQKEITAEPVMGPETLQ